MYDHHKPTVKSVGFIFMPRINKPKRPWAPKAKNRNDIQVKFYQTPIWKIRREQVLERDEYLCQECLRRGILTPLRVHKRDYAVDHIIPINQGGHPTDMDNLESLCEPCHAKKSAKEKGTTK